MSQYVIDEDKEGKVIVVLNQNSSMWKNNLQSPAFGNVKIDERLGKVEHRVAK